ncbi:MAG TPA: aminodeoxychorismate/anthranilate synthase component II [Candidatus Saccharimonadales bacterium]|nr:aminodeoxychorismate/anthranilate synthase component II [Candidatus Saccharimonadales bacterium]
MLLVIDNYDSFTYNLVQFLGELGADPVVRRNDQVTVDEIANGGYRGLVISPGPGEPKDAGISLAAIRELGGRMPILGVCLGHQAIGEAFGGRIVRAPRPIHGKSSRVKHDGRGIFAGVPDGMEVARYHSLVIEPQSCPDVLEVTAETADGIIMGVRHRSLPIEGVQFHPESVLTGNGMQILSNFVQLCGVAPLLA